MHLNQLRYFVSVAAYRSFTQAADAHYLTQTAITQQIKALEESLGLQLIDRRKRPVQLTEAGKVFYQEAKVILARIDHAVVKARDASTGASGVVRIGYEKGYERSNLSDRLRAFHHAYPNILITCTRLNTDHLAQQLLADDLDIIFAWDSTGLQLNNDISALLDLCSGLTVALYAGHPLASRPCLRRADLKDQTLIYLSPSASGDSIGDTHYIQLYEKAGYQPRLLQKSNDIESVLMMVAAEEGISILPSYSVEKLNNAANLVFVPLEGEQEQENIYRMWKKDCSNLALHCLLTYLAR